MGQIFHEMGNFLLNFSVFIWALCCIPILIFNYFVLRLNNAAQSLFTKCLHPKKEFFSNPSGRTLTDTHRNQGIRCVLLTVRGPIEIECLKRHLLEVVKRKDKFGRLEFPRLGQKLVSVLGTYAWEETEFNVEQHLVLAPYSYRGRSITELNVQDCVSEIVTKYLPIDIPPWQVTLIPSIENRHYILVRIHHALHCEGLNIADLLPLCPTVRHTMKSELPTSPLVGVCKKPEKIPYLIERLTEEMTNHWNEFISNYDPLEQPELLKCPPGFYQFLAIVLITFASTFREVRRGLYMIKPDLISRLKFLKSTWQKESFKRRVNLETFTTAIWTTINPLNMTKVVINFWVKIVPKFFVRIPIAVYNEILAAFTCVTMNHCSYPNTFVYTIYNYSPLLFYAGKEFLSYFIMFFETPARLLKEFVVNYTTVETLTLCGRKVVAWSKPVQTSYIQQLASVTGLSETEIVLSAISNSICRYIIKVKDKRPIEIPISCRHISSDYIFASGPRVRPEDSVSGYLSVTLPIFLNKMNERDNITEKLAIIRQNFAKAREEQPLTYLLSWLHIKYRILNYILPSGVLTVLLKYLTKKYSVSYTEVMSNQPDVMHKTIWGQDVTSVLYWTPPQANISMSICLNQYADFMILGIMADAQLAPFHNLFVKSFPQYLDNLGTCVGL